MTLAVSHQYRSYPCHSYSGLAYFTGGPDHDRLGFRYWKNPGPFVQFDGISGAKGRFLGWWAVLTQAAFSFIGTEIVAVSTLLILFGRARFQLLQLQIAAGEAKNPRRNLPRAIKRVYIRESPSASIFLFLNFLPLTKGILLFYIGGTLVIGLLVPSNDSGLNLSLGTAASSPFVIAIKRSGIKALPSVCT